MTALDRIELSANFQGVQPHRNEDKEPFLAQKGDLSVLT